MKKKNDIFNITQSEYEKNEYYALKDIIIACLIVAIGVLALVFFFTNVSANDDLIADIIPLIPGDDVTIIWAVEYPTIGMADYQQAGSRIQEVRVVDIKVTIDGSYGLLRCFMAYGQEVECFIAGLPFMLE